MPPPTTRVARGIWQKLAHTFGVDEKGGSLSMGLPTTKVGLTHIYIYIYMIVLGPRVGVV